MYPTNPLLSALVQTLSAEVEAQKQQQADVLRKMKHLEDRLDALELQMCQNVPEGCIPIEQAYYRYGDGMTEEAFHLAMTRLGVPVALYPHVDAGGLVNPAIAYLETTLADVVQRVFHNPH